MTLRIALCTVALLVGPTGLLAAQSIPTGTVTGTVISQTQPVAGVTVVATSPALQGRRTATTNAQGEFTLPLLPAGDYELDFSLQGLEPVTRGIRVSSTQ